jgi:hypothetical protein
MKSAIAAFAMLAVISIQTLAAAPLPAGKPAGLREAAVRHHRFPLLLTAGAAIVAVAAIVVATQNSGDTSCGTACSPTSTSP